MSPDKHLFSGAVTGTALLAATDDKRMAAGCFLGNFLCDIDHLIEYAKFCAVKKRMPSFGEFMSGNYFAEKKKIVLIFHGWEYLILLVLLSRISRKRGLIGFTLGYAIHLILDTLGNDCTVKGYSIIYRKSVGWDIKKICVKEQSQ